MTAAISVVRLKITLDDVEPVVMRRLEIPLALRLDRLHLVIQTAMGWMNTHLYEFRAGDMEWGIPSPDWELGSGPFAARKATFFDVIEEETLKYLYDFGDGWEHTVKTEGITAADPELLFPWLFEAEGRCPPEDVGGPPGYEEFLEAMADLHHARHTELHEWFGEDFDPLAVNIAEINMTLIKLGKRWRHGTKSKSKPASR